jgi:alpha-glucosidase
MDGGPALASGFEVVDAVTTSHRGAWTACYGQQAKYSDDYSRLDVTLREQLPPNREVSVELRVYDQGVALRYRLRSEADAAQGIIGEATEFRLGEAAKGYQQRWPEDDYRLTQLHDLHKLTESPLVVRLPAGGLACVTEAGTDAFSRMRLAPDQWQRDVLRLVLEGTSHVAVGQPTPWRVIGLADREIDLIGMEALILALSTPCELPSTDWIRPGKMIREVTISTRGGKACVDFAVAQGLQYILYDAGWYGFEYDDHADPAAPVPDPRRTKSVPDYDGLDLQEVIHYARERNVGVFLYVNSRAAERYWQTMIPMLADWGVAGIKFGFVNVGSAGRTKLIHDMVRRCADNKLLVDIHDFYRPVGFSRAFPNLLTQEGTRGNEHFPTATHNVTLPFTRYVIGPADYTICYRHQSLKTLDAHQLAMSVVYYSPLQVLFWYSKPADYVGVQEIEFFQNVPTTWDQTLALSGAIGEHVVIARRSGKTWYVGAMTGDAPISLSVPLEFLSAGTYQMTQHIDKPDAKVGAVGTTQTSVSQVTRNSTLRLELPACGGAAIRFEPKEMS